MNVDMEIKDVKTGSVKFQVGVYDEETTTDYSSQKLI